MKETRSAGIAIFRYTEDERHEILLVSPYGKAYGVPKGHVENGETDIEAAVREVDEEVPGLDYEIFEDVQPFTYTLQTKGDDYNKQKPKAERGFREPELKTVIVFMGALIDGDVDEQGNVKSNWENKYAKFFPLEDVKTEAVHLAKSAKATIIQMVSAFENINEV